MERRVEDDQYKNTKNTYEAEESNNQQPNYTYKKNYNQNYKYIYVII